MSEKKFLLLAAIKNEGDSIYPYDPTAKKYTKEELIKSKEKEIMENIYEIINDSNKYSMFDSLKYLLTKIEELKEENE